MGREEIERALATASRVLRFRRVMLVTFAIGALVSVAVTVRRPRHYKSETLIHYREGIRNSALVGGETGEQSAQQLVLKVRELVLSRTRLAQIIRELDLYPNLVASRGELEAVEEMRRHLAFVSRDGESLTLSFDGEDPKVVQAVTARLAADLIAESDRSRAEGVASTRDFLDVEMRRGDEDLQHKETALAAFLEQHPEFARQGKAEAGGAILAAHEKRSGRRSDSRRSSTSVADPTDVELRTARRELSEKRTRFTERHPDVLAAQSRVNELTARAARPRAPTPAVSVRPVENVEVRSSVSAPAAQRVVGLETEWMRLNREVAEGREQHEQLERKKFTATITASSRTSGLNGQMVVVDPAYLPLHAVPPSRATLLGFGLAMSALLALGVGWACSTVDDRLWNRFDVVRLGLTPLLTVVPRDAAAATRRSKGPSDGKGDGIGKGKPVVRRPARADTILMRPRNQTLIGPFLRAPMAAPQLRETAALPPPGQETMPGVFVDAQHPAPGERPIDPRLFLSGAPDSEQAASFRQLRHRLRQLGDPRVIAVTSAHAGEGKTTCAANLALAFAECRRAKVLLVEANLARPSLAALFDVKPVTCFSAQLDLHRENPQADWWVVEVAPGSIHLAAVRVGAPERTGLDGPTFARAIQLLRRDGYDYIILDTPPVLGSADVSLLEDVVDGLLLVARAGRTSSRALSRAVEQLPPSKVLGLSLIDG